MKPKPSVSISSKPKPKPKPKPKSSNATASVNEEKHRRHPLQHLNLNLNPNPNPNFISISSSTTSTSTSARRLNLRSNNIEPTPGHSLQFSLSHSSSSSSSSSTTTTTTNTSCCRKTKKPNLAWKTKDMKNKILPRPIKCCPSSNRHQNQNQNQNQKQKQNQKQSRSRSRSTTTTTTPLPFQNSSSASAHVDVTPFHNKIPTTTTTTTTTTAAVAFPSCSSASGEGNDIKTPPVQASVSPDLHLQFPQCPTSTTSTTPACYAAGHMLSGVSDKRKCRPLGLLSVTAKGKALTSFDYSIRPHDSHEALPSSSSSSSSSSVPLPVEASMHWLFSPSSTTDLLIPDDFPSLSPDISLNSPTLTLLPTFPDSLDPLCFPSLVPLFSPPHVSHPSLPNHQPHFLSLLHPADTSPFSVDSLGTAPVILTPDSLSSSGILNTTHNCHTNELHSELTSVVEALQMSSLSPITNAPIGDGHGHLDKERDSIALSFHFDSPTTSCSSVFLSHVHQIPDDHQASWNSCSTVVNESHMRTSWKEGLIMSQIDEMAEFDSCGRLSDDEEDAANGCANDVFQLCEASDVDAANASSDRILTKSDCCTAEILYNETGVKGKGLENYPCRPPELSCSCAESISTDGGGLLASADSDWALCYRTKNELFQV